jgi:uncharacterized membrane protein YeaQ/YmgE (transglycosylase-associated protein family)
MGLIWSIVIGFVVGLIARFLMPGRDSAGFIVTTLLGILGAFIASFLGHSMGLYRPDEPAGFFASVIGAMLVLFIYRLAVGRRGTVVR